MSASGQNFNAIYPANYTTQAAVQPDSEVVEAPTTEEENNAAVTPREVLDQLIAAKVRSQNYPTTIIGAIPTVSVHCATYPRKLRGTCCVTTTPRRQHHLCTHSPPQTAVHSLGEANLHCVFNLKEH